MGSTAVLPYTYCIVCMYSVRDDFTVVFKRVAWLCTWALHLGSASPQDQEISVTLHLGVICLKIWCGIWVLKLLIYAQIFWHFPFIMHLSYCILIFSYHLLYFDNLRCVCFLKTNKIINYLGYFFFYFVIVNVRVGHPFFSKEWKYLCVLFRSL